MIENREIPCEDCEKKKHEIEEDGLWEVIGCKPIEEKPGWCRLEYKFIG